jgi:hypothetical protein
MTNMPKSLRFQFSLAPDYRLLAANGAWGGITTSGLIAADLYVDRQALPEATILRISDGTAGNEEKIPPDSEERLMEREVQVGLLLTPEAARVIGQWLIGKADEHDRLVPRMGIPAGDSNASDTRSP